MAGGKLLISRGTADITSAIALDSYQQVVGMGKYTTTLRQGDSADCNVFCMSDDNTHRYGIGIRSLRIDGNKDNNTTGNGIVMYAPWYTVIEDVMIYECSEKGIYYADAGDAGQHAAISRVDISYCDGTGLHLDHGVTDSDISAVWCYDNGQVTGSNAIIDASGGTHIYHLHCSPSPDSTASNVVINAAEHMTIHGLQIADDLEAAHGLEIYADSAYAMMMKIDGGYIHNEASGAHTGYGLYLHGTVATSKKVWRNTISGLYVDGYAYNVYCADAKVEGNQICNNTGFYNAATAAVYDAGTNNRFFGNQGHIHTGEIREYSGSIATLTQNAYNSIDNPFGQDVLVVDAAWYYTTKSTDAATLDSGIGSSATTDYTTLLANAPLNSTAPVAYHSVHTATYGQQTTPLLWQTGAGNRYLNMSIKDAAGTGLVCKYMLRVMGV